jgi:hypothetical protein
MSELQVRINKELDDLSLPECVTIKQNEVDYQTLILIYDTDARV